MPSGDVGIAFALVIGAGASTAIGAGVVFAPALVKLASRKTLAGALGLSAGVMVYVSFVEIFAKSSASFEDAGFEADVAYSYATLCFIGGVVFMLMLNHLVTALLGGHHHHHSHGLNETRNETRRSSGEDEVAVAEETPANPTEQVTPLTCPCCSEDPAGDLEQVHDMAEEIERYEQSHADEWNGVAVEHNDEDAPASELGNQSAAPSGDAPSEDVSQDVERHADKNDSQKLMRMSVNTGLAIAIHNFPEGLATFVAALNDTKVGAVLAVAIAIHNIPEGLCVAMPVYYATGSRWKAFGWAVLSGVSEPFAALLGWAVLANSFSDTLYAVLFGVVAGMMVIISARELLPTAHRYDPEDSVVTYSFMGGMAIMAVSLVLFVL